ncbi:hypothetical protein BU15DRAFT_67031 [Melanogaster broomeanus]|nr:hypothetical protein BU15DRAFT_67031 [Melanogaster broomeanus]
MTTEIAMAKAKERCRRKVEKKRHEDEEARLREEEEKRRREEEEKHLWEEQEKCLREEQEAEAEHKRREEEQRQREEAQRKAAEANKKRQREEVEAGSSVARGSGMCCVRCARAGVPCEFTNDGNKRRTACDRCAAQREKCEWPEMHAPGTGKGKAKAKEVPTLPASRREEETSMQGESARRRRGRDCWREHLRKARRAFEIFVDEAAICGTPEESEEESSEEEVDEGELQEELAGLDEEQAENPMSPLQETGYMRVRW